MTEHRLSREAFADALQKGLGRAALHVRLHGDAGVRAELLHACLHSVAFDAESESSRVSWLLGMIDGTADPAFYREAILAKLAVFDGTDDETWDWVQICDFALHYAQRGCSEARLLIYGAHAEALQTSYPWLGYEEILVLDGLDGLDWVVGQVGRAILAGGECTGSSDSAIGRAREMFGEAVVEAHLKHRAAENEAIAACLALLKTCEERQRLASNPSASASFWEARLLQELDGPVTEWELGEKRAPPYLFISLGGWASDERIASAFERLLVEQDPIVLLRILTAFYHRALPRLEPRVFELAAHEDAVIAAAAQQALGNTRDPSVRRLGLERLASAASIQELAMAAVLLKNNVEPHDIEPLLARLPRHCVIDEEERIGLHHLGETLLGMTDASPSAAFEPLMLWLYESTPCANCRREAVHRLHDWKLLSANIAAECRDDAAEETRELFDESPTSEAFEA